MPEDLSHKYDVPSNLGPAVQTPRDVIPPDWEARVADLEARMTALEARVTTLEGK